MARILSSVLSHAVFYRNPGAIRFIRCMVKRGHPLAFALVMTGVYTVARLGLAAEVTPDLERLIGRSPTAFDGFARDHPSIWR